MLDENEYKDVQPSGDSEYHFASKDQSEPNFTEHIYQKPSYEDTPEAAPQSNRMHNSSPTKTCPKKKKKRNLFPRGSKLPHWRFASL